MSKSESSERPEIDEVQAAEFAGQFLQRVQLQGQEVPAFNMVMDWLSSKRSDAEPSS